MKGGHIENPVKEATRPSIALKLKCVDVEDVLEREEIRAHSANLRRVCHPLRVGRQIASYFLGVYP